MNNRLGDESSLYLRQHADNPVDWHAWSPQALARAREQRKPILLSIGYSACHWCHVMAHESFEDAATARVMNELFVNIKVDREERPDLDKIYQLAHQALSRRGGGWPLTVFLAPDTLLPFYAGTYFPPQPRHGLPSFVEVLRGVRRWYDEHPEELAQQNAALGEFLADYGNEHAPLAALDETPVHAARQRIAASFDDLHGGHRGGPKFPPATELELLRRLARHGDDEADVMATLTLRRMAERGLQDHLAGGFFRYCVDAYWDIPHFEKMLYDNAALLALYAAAASEREEPEFAHAAAGIVRWLQDEMALADGGYASALDADSEGEEGRYYLWQRDEVVAVLGAEDSAAFGAVYGLDAAPNFEHHAWHLQRKIPFDPSQPFTHERERLRERRAQRVRPARDDKRLTSWNAQLLRALARGATHVPAWQAHADALLATLRAQAWHDSRLYALTPATGTRVPGFLDDYAFLLDAQIERLALQWREADAQWAAQLADVLLAEFEDRERGGFWFTPHAHEALPQRPKPWFDDATPSGNAVAARALLRLGHLLGEPRWLDAAERTLRAGLAATREAPHGACALIETLHELLHPDPVVVLRADGSELSDWDEVMRAARRSGVRVYAIASDANSMADKPHQPGGLAYVCVGMRCLAPVTVSGELLARLQEARS